MADTLCGPSNALHDFRKHTSVDRTLQQDRFRAGPSSRESFRSSPGPGAGALDADFEAFQSYNPLTTGYPEPAPQHFHENIQHGLIKHERMQQGSVTGLPDWTTDFQNLHLKNPVTSPPLFQQAAAPAWSHDFMQQAHEPQQQSSQSTQPNHLSLLPVPSFSQFFQPPTESTSFADAKDKQPQASEELLDAAFSEAFAHVSAQFDAASSSPQTQTPSQAQVQEDDGISYRFGSDLILSQAESQPQQSPKEEQDDLARTAGSLLTRVEDEMQTSEKFAGSAFLGLMRRLRDGEAVVRGDDIVSSSDSAVLGTTSSEQMTMATDKEMEGQPLHPGGVDYPM